MVWDAICLLGPDAVWGIYLLFCDAKNICYFGIGNSFNVYDSKTKVALPLRCSFPLCFLG
ncbi:hypothetical protein K710_0320 [Streptococcus iniae SF1]|nr:hypothetical protein K710_0320 [Streptococcus iniae SF1]